MVRKDGRLPDQLRPVRIHRHFLRPSAGSVLIEFGNTRVICTANIEEQVPPWLMEQKRGWITAEYGMLPGATSPRKARERSGRVDGRTAEIQRLIGRSLRAVTNLEALGPRSIIVDCDVLEADGGTRTAAITGAWIALVDAVRQLASQHNLSTSQVIRHSVAAVSVGVVEGQILLDLNKEEDNAAAVDFNFVIASSGKLVEVQGTAEQTPFSEEDLLAMLALARPAACQLFRLQREALGEDWPLSESEVAFPL
ncbi:MAG: ribonuclease PH [Thermoguttaceae bacterium]|nr:ribonuclease PH [Thermoguttaceae bacterium]MDW8080219.1 ribonuclease PH [Thermoguttaceae bacterium]